jgi:hypothetical protein
VPVPVPESKSMKSILNVASQPAAIPIVADELVEFHSSRLLLLLVYCGTGGRIEGLTKLAKLDFFVRYPSFFWTLANELGESVRRPVETVESPMIRFHYGPWDKRYYQVLSYLEARHLIEVRKMKATFVFSVTEEGKAVAKQLAQSRAFSELIQHMKSVKHLLGGRSGSAIKQLIYRVFDAEITHRKLGDLIR